MRQATQPQSYARIGTIAASLAVAAGLIHLVAAPDHFNEWWGYGYFFLAVGVGQVLYGLLLFRQPQQQRAFYALGLLAVLSILALYVLTRTLGIPLGPAAGERERVGALDVASKLVELALLAVLAWMARSATGSHVSETDARPNSGLTVVPAPALESVGRSSRPGISRRTVLAALGGGLGVAAAWALSSRSHRLGKLGGPSMAAAQGKSFATSAQAIPAAGGEVREYQLTAARTKWQLSDRQTVDAWTYNGQLPGPELRSKVGDLVKITLTNNLPEETTVHWHGVDVPNAMDGVPGVTQAPIPAGGTFTYQFVVETPGTFWYHSHVNEMTQVCLRSLHPFEVRHS